MDKEDDSEQPGPPIGPVSWFLGLELINRLRGLVLSGLQHEFDTLDWMDARDPASFRDWEGQSELWFDYIADIGDGYDAMASLAYLVQRPLASAALDTSLFPGAVPAELPRGKFLFVGGDWAYPASDVHNLKRRVIEPFAATRDPDDKTRPKLFGIPANHDYYDDLVGFNRLVRKPVDPLRARRHRIGGYTRSQQASYVRIVLPHDWELWGLDVYTKGIDFAQMRHFRPVGEQRPRRLIVCTQRPAIVLDRDDSTQSHRDGLMTLHLSTKFATLAGVPGEERPEPTCDDACAKDEAKRKKTRDARNEARAAGRSIAGPAAKRDVSGDDDRDEGLEELDEASATRATDARPEKLDEPMAFAAGDPSDGAAGSELEGLDCRLDLSGDIHHYARYGAVDGEHQRADTHAYANVISGGGGAFLHPTYFDGAIHARTKYPSPKRCLALLGRSLVSFVTPLLAGHAWLLAGLVALAIHAGFPAVAALTTQLGRLSGAPALVVTVSIPDIAMALGFVLALALPIVWHAWARPALLGRRRGRRLRCYRPKPFRNEGTPYVTRWEGVSCLRRMLDRSALAGLVWVSVNIALTFACLLAPPWIAASHCPGASLRGVLGVLATLFFVAGGIAFAVALGGAHATCKAKVFGFLPLGIAHAAMQLTLPAALICYGTLSTALAVIGVQFVCMVLIAALTRMPDGIEPSRREQQLHARPTGTVVMITALWILQWLASIGVLAAFGRSPQPASLDAWTIALVVIAGSAVCVHQFGWYLLVGFAWGGHNNEAGSAIRCQRYKQFIRFHIDREGTLSGYVIAVDKPVRAPQQVPRARIVDVFRMKPRPR